MSQSTSPSPGSTPPRKRFKPSFAQAVPALPHSWGFDSWPTNTYPSTSERARYLFRFHKDELVRAGAVCRIGTKIVFLGAGYNSWMSGNTARVIDFESTIARTTSDDSAPRQQLDASIPKDNPDRSEADINRGKPRGHHRERDKAA